MVKDFEYFIREEGENNILKDLTVFDIGYLPDEIHKRKETETLFKEISRFVNYKTPNHILLTGPPGLGKTVTIKYICKREILQEKGIESLYINCRDKTTTQILLELIEELDIDTPQKNLSNHELMKIFLKIIKSPLLLILDEIDRGRKVGNLLYALSRTRENESIEHPPISLILVSNNLSWDDYIDASVRSSLQLSRVLFQPYKTNELNEILKQRVKLGFYNENAIPLQEIELIAKKTVDEKRSDCRVALKTLLYAAQYADNQSKKKIEKKDIEHNFYIAVKDIERERITRLHNSQLLILYSCCVNKEKSFTEVFDWYDNNSKELNLNSLSQSMVYYWMEYLFNQGLININTDKVKTNGIPKKTLVINPLIDEKLVIEELNKRMLRLENQDAAVV